MLESFKQTPSLITIRFLLLLYVAKGSSSLNLREKQTILNRILQPCKGKPNSYAWNIQWLFWSNRLPSILTRGSGPPQATAGPYAHPICKTYVYSVTTWLYSCPLCGMYSRTLVRVKNQITSGGRYAHSSSRSVTRLTAYHISRHVASTFTHLTTTTTHCDLSNFYQHRRGFYQGHESLSQPRLSSL
jgi:hypothetical protein